MKSIDDIAAALQGYDPQALSVDQVNAFLRELVQPVSADESQDVYLFDALSRVLAQDVISPISVPTTTQPWMALRLTRRSCKQTSHSLCA